MIVSEKALTWALRFYPPLLLQRVWVKKIKKDFLGAEVKVSKSIFNINFNRSIFGGTIFAATDPFFAVCLFQILTKKGYKVRVWTKSASIQFIKPAYTSLHFSFSISDDQINEICNELNSDRKCSKSYPLEIFDTKGELCAFVSTEVHVRKTG